MKYNLHIDTLIQWLNDTIFPIFSRGTPSEKSFRKRLLRSNLFILIFFIFPFSFFNLNCNNKPILPPDDKPIYTQCISLTTEEIGVTDAWLKVKFTDTTVNRSFKLVRDGQTVLSALCSSLDTVVLDENLLPNHIYNYKALRLVDTKAVDSALLDVTTMDTTSHNFTWTSYVLGDGNSSLLNDVAIVKDTCVWVVGEIYKRDSTGQIDPSAYNAAYWNGVKWELKRILMHDWGGVEIYAPIQTVIAFSPNDIWAASGAELVHWNGNIWTSKAFFMVDVPFNGQVLKMWGTSGNNIYCVGRTGAIYHYNGTDWTKIESGTTLDINDIYGTLNKKTGEYEVLAVAAKLFSGHDRKIIKISNTSTEFLSDIGIDYALATLWFTPNKHYYLFGGSFYEKKRLTDASWVQKFDLTSWYLWRIRGTEINDVVAAGAYGELLHFNGYRWKSFLSVINLGDDSFSSVDIKGNLIVAVGMKYPRAFIAVGRRN